VSFTKNQNGLHGGITTNIWKRLNEAEDKGGKCKIVERELIYEEVWRWLKNPFLQKIVNLKNYYHDFKNNHFITICFLLPLTGINLEYEISSCYSYYYQGKVYCSHPVIKLDHGFLAKLIMLEASANLSAS
jgi:hypothetical protein